MMTRTEIKAAIAEANRFIEAAGNVLVEMDSNQEWDYESGKQVIRPVDQFYSGRRSTGALRRKSLDLTRALADLRRAGR